MKTIVSTNGYEIIVDDEDYEMLNEAKWRVQCSKKAGSTYAISFFSIRGERHYPLMHRALIGALPTEIVDHINGNKLDNRKSNLRFCTSNQNMWNRAVNKNSKSGSKGVCYCPNRNGNLKWMVRIKVFNKSKTIGAFATKEAATIAYNTAALKYHGEFAKLNEL